MTETPFPGRMPGEDDSVNDDAVNTEYVNDEVPAAAADAAAGDPAETEREVVGETTFEPTTGRPSPAAPSVHPDTALAAERLDDLQRLQAEYVNYKRRVDRDRAVVQEAAVQSVLDALLPVLDDIHAARQHGDLVAGPFASIADKLESTLGKFGLERFGDVGVEFDPLVHEALMHTSWDADNPALPKDATTTTVVTVLQPGYRTGDRVIRPARVAVADPA